MSNIQERTLGQLRRSVGKNLGVVIDGTTTSTTDTTSIISTSDLFGGDDEHNQKSVKIYDTTEIQQTAKYNPVLQIQLPA